MPACIGGDEPIFAQKFLPPCILPILMAARHSMQKQQGLAIAFHFVIQLNPVCLQNAHCSPFLQCRTLLRTFVDPCELSCKRFFLRLGHNFWQIPMLPHADHPPAQENTPRHPDRSPRGRKSRPPDHDRTSAYSCNHAPPFALSPCHPGTAGRLLYQDQRGARQKRLGGTPRPNSPRLSPTWSPISPAANRSTPLRRTPPGWIKWSSLPATLREG